MSYLSSLNKKQKQAAQAGAGPLLIVAGAGTGKTRVITNRIAYLIEKKGISPEEILAVTFTDKASQEMIERVDQLLSQGYRDLWVSTFHSFCERVLRDHGLDIGLPTDFKLADQTLAWLLMRQNLDKLQLDYYAPIGNPSKFLHTLIDHFSKCKDQAIMPEDYLKYSQKAKEDKDRLKEIALAYGTYQQLLLDNNLLDFGDLLLYCLKLFKDRPKILEKYCKQFKYILVDEFQDTNWIQYQLVKLLASPRNNLTVCACDDQSIYKFRGASYGNILQFKKDFKKAKEVSLIDNYRSFQNILDLAHKFIQANNPNRLESLSKISKKLKAVKKGKGQIAHLHFQTAEQEIQGVIEKMIEIMKKDKLATFNDFVVLVRANNQAMRFARAFERSKVPYQFLALKGLYSKPIILDIISYFKFLDNYHESSAAFRILSLPFLNIPSQDIVNISQYSYKKSKSIFESLQELPLIGGVSRDAQEKITNILSLVRRHTEMAVTKNVSEILLAFLENSGYLEYLVKQEKKEDLELVSQFHNRIKIFEESHLDARLKSFMEELNLELDSGEEGKLSFDPDSGPEVVRIMTIHSAKGLEFNYVFLVNLVDKRFPSSNRRDPIEIPSDLIKDILPKGDFHLEEERRLFYVAATRAKKGLFLTSAENYGGVQSKRLSRFLTELNYSKAITPLKNKAIRVKTRPHSEKMILPERFSFTQLTAFQKCPLQYKFAHIIKIPIKGKAVFSFGKTMHETLFQFFLEASSKKASLERLLQIYQDQWIEDWYQDKNQRQKYFEAGKKSLEGFYENYSKNNPKILFLKDKPALEQDFNLKINGHTIRGKIDRIDVLEDGVEIIDYKTGSVKDKLRPEDKKQLLIYQLAAEEVLGLKPKKLTYYYLDENKTISFLGSEIDKEKEKQAIVEEIEKIKRSNFFPTPGWQCDWCDFKNICEHSKAKNGFS
ncbi:ATP-dependent helicase [Patescibacteria group bacterium]|nr:ATP-dependent helicase [Patescibacteria group bacterium]